MPCAPLVIKNKVVGHICWSNRYHLGPHIWMEWHHYCGPTFYSDRNCQKWLPDWYEDPAIVAAFDKWLAKHKGKV